MPLFTKLKSLAIQATCQANLSQVNTKIRIYYANHSHDTWKLHMMTWPEYSTMLLSYARDIYLYRCASYKYSSIVI